MRGQLIGKLLPTARIFVLELNACRSQRIAFGGFGHAHLLKLLGRGFRLGGELRAFVRCRAIAAAGDYQRPRAIGISEAEVQCRKSTHGQANDVRLVDLEGIEHRANVIAGAFLRIELAVCPARQTADSRVR